MDWICNSSGYMVMLVREWKGVSAGLYFRHSAWSRATCASSWWIVVATVMASVRLWWRLWVCRHGVPERMHVAWLNSCGLLKVTHKVSVPLQLVIMLMRWSVMCCYWRCVGCYLDIHGSMIAMLLMLGEQIHLILCMMANSGLWNLCRMIK
jgi:hypothetical protein